MSYAGAAALQVAIYQHLAVHLPGVAVVDALPNGAGTGSFVLIGPEEVLEAGDQTGRGAEHRFVISVISDAAGFLEAKEIAVRVSDALEGAPLVLSRGRLVRMQFLKAQARRLQQGEARRIDLRFVARLEI